MVITYLRKIQNEFIKNKSDLEKELEQQHILLKENIEFQNLLEETSDLNYELFTPREVNRKNKTKLQELKEEHKGIIETLKKITAEYEETSAKLEEITVVIDNALIDDNGRSTDSENDIFTGSSSNQVTPDFLLKKLNGALSKIDLSSKLIEVDPNRSKMELKMLYNDLQQTIEKINQMNNKSKEDEPCL